MKAIFLRELEIGSRRTSQGANASGTENAPISRHAE
jgi:hypothetical protein